LGRLTLQPEGVRHEGTALHLGFVFGYVGLCGRRPIDPKSRTSTEAPWIAKLSLDSAPKFFYTPSPDGRKPFADLIAGAQKDVLLYMYRMTDNGMIAVLKKAAQRGIKVQVLLDPVKLKEASMQAKMKNMIEAGIQVRGGSELFSMTHAKSMVVDGKLAIVSTMNLTWTFKDNRGFGVVIDDKSIIQEISAMFEADWKMAGGETVTSPAVADANLIWTPDNSENKLIDLVRASRKSIEIAVENLGATPLLDELILAEARGVKIRVIVPLCTTSSNPLHNSLYVQKLLSGKIEVRNMPLPISETSPYTHAKMMAVDGRLVYLGSQNFSKNSLQKSRELGIIVNDEALYSDIYKVWSSDWQIAVPPPAKTDEGTCPIINWGPKPPRTKKPAEPKKAA
jgi:cardiolipin synthase